MFCLVTNEGREERKKKKKNNRKEMRKKRKEKKLNLLCTFGNEERRG